MSGNCAVHFAPGACDLRGASEALTGHGLRVITFGKWLVVHRPGGPMYRVRLIMRDPVEVASVPMVKGSSAPGLPVGYEARFEIECLNRSRESTSIPQEIPAALVEATHGVAVLASCGDPFSGPI